MEFLRPYADNLVNYCQSKLGFAGRPRLLFKDDEPNSKNLLGYTAHYNPGKKEIAVFTTGRHPKDVLRSIAHELIHHHQHSKGMFDKVKGDLEPGYAQKDPHMRNMEKQAYLLGNLFFRDWEDGIKTKNKEIKFMIAEKKIRRGLRQAMTEVLKEENFKYEVKNFINEEVKKAVVTSVIDREIKAALNEQSASKGLARIQKKLSVRPDGMMGPETVKAIKIFQKNNNLDVDGRLGPKTMAALQGGVKENVELETIRTPEQEARFHSSIFEPKLVALHARLVSDWIKPK